MKPSKSNLFESFVQECRPDIHLHAKLNLNSRPCGGSLLRWFIGSLVSWFIGLLVHWLVGWLVGWFVRSCVRSFVRLFVRFKIFAAAATADGALAAKGPRRGGGGRENKKKVSVGPSLERN